MPYGHTSICVAFVVHADREEEWHIYWCGSKKGGEWQEFNPALLFPTVCWEPTANPLSLSFPFSSGKHLEDYSEHYRNGSGVQLSTAKAVMSFCYSEEITEFQKGKSSLFLLSPALLKYKRI